MWCIMEHGGNSQSPSVLNGAAMFALQMGGDHRRIIYEHNKELNLSFTVSLRLQREGLFSRLCVVSVVRQ